MFEHIVAFQARYRPQAVAISTVRGDISFHKLDADTDRVSRRLAGLARPGATVAVQVAGAGLHLVMLMALARLGCVSASLPAIGERQESDLLELLRPDLLLTDRQESPNFQTLKLTQEWLTETFEAPHEPVPAYDFAPSDPVRIVMSSGTTGTPKKMIFTRAVVDARVRTGGLSQMGHRRIHAAVGLDTETGFRAPLVAWASGLAAVYPDAGFRWGDFLVRGRVQALVLVPAQLDGLLNSLAPDFKALHGLNVIIVSGALSPSLYNRAAEKLSPEIFVTYGSTEAGLAAQASPALLGLRDGMTGIVSPSAQIEVVDDEHKALHWGEVGRVRVRSEEMVAGYLDDNALTEKFFYDGWFYPGDLGSLDAAGALTVRGRETEIFDLGGSRISPDAIEAVLLNCPGVRDAGAFSISDGEAIPQIRAAIVISGGCDLEAVHTRLKIALPQLKVGLLVLGEIPRSERGKIDRGGLQREAAQLNASRTSSEITGTA